MSEYDFVVIRPAADLPPGFLPPELDGCWYDLRDVPLRPGATERTAQLGGAVAVATGRFEVREDGAVAEVFEVRP